MKPWLCTALLIAFFLFTPVISAHADSFGDRIAVEVCILGDGHNFTIDITEGEAAQWKASAINGSVFKTLFNGHERRNFNGYFTKQAGSDIGKCVRSFMGNQGQEVCHGSDVELIEGTTTIRQYDIKQVLCP